MPRPVASRTASALSTSNHSATSVSWELLWHEVSINLADGLGEDERVRAALDALVTTARSQLQRFGAYSYEIKRHPSATSSALVVLEGSDELGTAEDSKELVNLLFSRLFRRSFEFASRCGWVRVHAGLVDFRGQRILLVGPSGAGKSSTALRLAELGGVVQSDESVLLRDGLALGVPRLLHLKADAPDFLPTARRIWNELAVIPGTDVRCIDPSRIGGQWELTARRIDHLFCLQNVASSPQIQTSSREQGFGIVLGEVIRCVESRATIARQIATGLSGSHAWQVSGGGGLDASALDEVLKPSK